MRGVRVFCHCEEGEDAFQAMLDSSAGVDWPGDVFCAGLLALSILVMLLLAF